MLRKIINIIIMIALMSPLSAIAHGDAWQKSSRKSANIAPHPQQESRAVIHAYAAQVWGWRGFFADHTWIATKPQDADSYTVYEVIGWRLSRGQPALRIEKDTPDRLWFGNRPKLLLDIRGDKAQQLIKLIDSAARRYPFPNDYRAFPGPNSNTFTAWIAQQVPELKLNLPFRAIGKRYIHYLSTTP